MKNISDDYELATQMVVGAPKAAARFASRFGHDVESAYEHCRDARQLGLSLENYRHSVAVAAARSFLNSLPVSSAGEGLNAHLTRVLGQRDFAVAVLLSDDVDVAWGHFIAKYGSYLRGLFQRTGRPNDELESLVEELVRDLRRRDGATGRLPISEFLGRGELRLWLFVYVRRSFRGGMQVGALDPERYALPRPVSESGENSVLMVLLGEIIEDEIQRLNPDDRHLLASIALGASLTAFLLTPSTNKKLRPADLLKRHQDLVGTVFQRVQKRMKERTFDRIDDADRRWPRLILTQLQLYLSKICAVEIPADDSSTV